MVMVILGSERPEMTCRDGGTATASASSETPNIACEPVFPTALQPLAFSVYAWNMNPTAIKEARRRLQGAWHSDRARTARNWVFPKKLAAARLKAFHDMFGKNTWRFARSICYFEFDGKRSQARYDILWADTWSIVVVFHLPQAEKCYQLFFEEDCFYIAAGRAGNAEYFCRSKG